MDPRIQMGSVEYWMANIKPCLSVMVTTKLVTIFTINLWSYVGYSSYLLISTFLAITIISIFSYVKLVCKGVSSYVQIVCKGVSDSGRNVYGDYKGGNMAYWLHAPHLSYHLHVPLLCGVGLKAEAMLRRHWLLFGLVTKFEDGFVSLYSFNFLMNLLLQIVNGRHRQAMSV